MLIRPLMGVRGKQKRSERTRRSASLQTAGGEPFRNDLGLPREYGGGFAAGIRRVACRQTPLRRTRLAEAQLQRTKCRKPIISPDMVGMGRGGWEPKGICLAKAMGICHKADGEFGEVSGQVSGRAIVSALVLKLSITSRTVTVGCPEVRP